MGVNWQLVISWGKTVASVLFILFICSWVKKVEKKRVKKTK